ncbi:MAG TPA: formate--tetrahydrofolate ligase [Thermoanaerobaculaceae bacterium]|nr:formate--tetrahydrofolate ligase [Thermoanaerobaculaceae bacterium]HRS17213.1 formate--tetrahydrofolate ligase [Thermoanaerobaculaceae bacterium]
MANGPRPIADIAARLGIRPQHLTLYGTDKAKVALEALESGREPGKLVLVSAITPTDAGEGKTTTSIGLAQGLARIGQSVCLALREPSLGPTFGLKGGATGGGRSIVVPAEDINLHFTGDFHAISTAHNLLAALLDNHIHQGNSLGIDPRRVLWRRVVDMNDRALRHIIIGLGGVLEGVPRETGFDITPASEVMAALCLAEDIEDLRRRLERIIVAFTFSRKPVTAADLKAVGAMLVLLKDALKPNLVQTIEGVPAFVHGGPFANIAHGCNSVVATRMALAHADWVITEAGFGFDLGAEKFFDIKCVSAGLDTAAVVLVATVRALKLHGGADRSELDTPDPAAVERGLGNLEKHIENIRIFCEPPVVALNRFPSDSEEEIEVVRRAAEEAGAPFAVSEVFARGGEGGIELAEAVIEHAEQKSRPFCPLYDWSEPVKVKLRKIARAMYGAREVTWSKEAERDLSLIRKLGYEGLPLCVAKTQKSLSDDPRLVGRPEDFEITVRELILAAGAGYIVPLLGDIIRMPGLPAEPQAERMDLVDGKVIGLMGA